MLDDEPEEEEYILDRLLPAGGLMFLSAPPGDGKSWLILDLAYSIASGAPFLSTIPAGTPEDSRRVGVLAFELPYRMVRSRTASLVAARRSTSSPYSLDALRDRVRIIPGTSREGHRFSLPTSLLDDVAQSELLAWIDRESLDVLVVDPLYRLVTSEEDLIRHAIPIVQILERIQGSMSKPLTLVVSAHNRKLGGAGDTGRGLDKMYGSTFLAAAASAVLSIERVGKHPDDPRRKLVSSKANFGIQRPPIYFQLDATYCGAPLPIPTALGGKGQSPAELRRRKTLDALQDLGRPTPIAELARILEQSRDLTKKQLGALARRDPPLVTKVGAGPATAWMATATKQVEP